MSALRYHLDEDCQSGALAAALRQHGIEVATTKETGLVGVDDERQLRNATERGFVTVLFRQQFYSIGEVVRRLSQLRREVSAEQMRDRLEWLSAWGLR